MYTKTLHAASVLALASHAAAVIHRVDVGGDELAYNPDTITVEMGDMIEYHFLQPNHSSILGDFNNPCQPAPSGGWFSGFNPVSSGSSEADNVFQVTINDTNPKFVYCGQNIGLHCPAGMSMVINPNNDQTLSAYRKAAQSVSSSGVPDSVFGGEVVAASMAQVTVAPSPTAAAGGGGFGGLYGGGGSPSDAGQIGTSLCLVAAIGFGLAAMIL